MRSSLDYTSAKTPPVVLCGQRRKRLLVVEDDAEVLEALCEVFVDDGYEVVRAGNGAEALRYFERAAPPDLIVLDLTMPVMDGYEFLERRALRRDLVAIPVLVLSATPAVRLSGRNVEFLPKPLDVDVLLPTVARLTTPRGRTGRPQGVRGAS